MSGVVSTIPLTPEDLLAMPDSAAYELIDGNLVERHMGTESSAIAMRIGFLLGMYLKDNPIGLTLGADTGYQCFPGAADKVRRADLGFVRFDRLPNGRPYKGFCRIPPDLAVEVVSPHDTVDELDAKIAEYLAADFPLIWVVSPQQRTVKIYRPRTAANGPISILSESDTISGEKVLPGFECPVKEFFAIEGAGLSA